MKTYFTVQISSDETLDKYAVQEELQQLLSDWSYNNYDNIIGSIIIMEDDGHES